jgi:nicotinamide-nucleotide amidase
VGFRLDAGSCRLYFMPGVPRELRRMADESVLPDLRRRLTARPPLVATLKLFGLGESEVAQRLEGIGDGLTDGLELVVQYRATFPEIHVRLVLEGDRGAAPAVLDELAATARQRLGRHVFAAGGARVETDFPQAVANVLDGTGMTLAAAEEASCGALARFMGSSDTGRQVFLGGLVAAVPGVLGAQLDMADVTAESAAEAIRRRFGSSIGVAALGSADGADERRAGALTVAAAGPAGSSSKELHFPIDHDRFQRLAAYAALKLAERIAHDQHPR